MIELRNNLSNKLESDLKDLNAKIELEKKVKNDIKKGMSNFLKN